MNFLSNLERLMLEHDINRTDLARACGLSISTVHTWWTRGYENISMKTLIKLSKFFHCSVLQIRSDQLLSHVRLFATP